MSLRDDKVRSGEIPPADRAEADRLGVPYHTGGYIPDGAGMPTTIPDNHGFKLPEIEVSDAEDLADPGAGAAIDVSGFPCDECVAAYPYRYEICVQAKRECKWAEPGTDAWTGKTDEEKRASDAMLTPMPSLDAPMESPFPIALDDLRAPYTGKPHGRKKRGK